MTHTRPKRPHPGRWLLVLAALIVIGGVAWGLKQGPLGLADSVGYAVCHQITVRTYVFGDLVMPLCARCSGQYLGAMAGFFMALVWGRLRASGLPSRGIIVTLVAFLAIWAFDGINSYVYLVTRETFLYMPHNILRLITGMLQGIAVSMFFLPFFNQVFWRNPDPRPVLRGWRDLGLLLLLTGALTLAVNSAWAPLFYPLAFLSVAGVFLLLSLVGVLIVVMVFRAENTAETGRDFLLFFIPGMAFATLLIAGIDAFRAWAESSLGFSMPE
jgi:uncharacterized membrane protein